MKAYKTRIVEISWCWQCPHREYGLGTDKCTLTKKRVSKINCTPFPKTCPLPGGRDYVTQKDAYGNKTIGDVLKCH